MGFVKLTISKDMNNSIQLYQRVANSLV